MSERDRCHLKRCRAALDITTDGKGRTIAVCPLCERNKKGICRGCPNRTQPSKGKVVTFWCKACKRVNDAKRHRRAYHAKPGHYRAVQRRIAKSLTPEQKAARLDYKRRWYHAHKEPPSERSRLYAREMAKQRRRDPVLGDKMRATRRAYENRPDVKARMRAYRRTYYQQFAA